MMFDRYNQTIFSKKLTRHKLERATVLVEFGVPDLTVDTMIPPEIVFPHRSGGFVTTDAKNMLHQPSIINTICDQVEKLNTNLCGQGTWRFVLPPNFLDLIKSAIETPQQAEAAQDVVVRLTVALSQSKIDIVRHWSKDKQNWDTTRFMDMVIRTYYKSFEFFAIVDAIESIPKANRPCHLDFVSTQAIIQTFS
ncbi:hypothetical protein BY458DRAFT_40957 [Sporodiniella umbellata]|nr:hypothetical protein BY458DRAFT_40957 [Sporodiniella umbellata]